MLKESAPQHLRTVKPPEVLTRHWKRAFEKDYDVENPKEHPRVELSSHRKAWLTRAWTHYFGYLPNAVPVYNESEGFTHRPGVRIQWHHVIPIGEVSRIDGQGSNIYNNPRHLVPVCELNHVGTHSLEEDFVVHPDTKEATQAYGLFKQGIIFENPYERMGKERREKTSRGEAYHDEGYDQYFLDLAERVVNKYTTECVGDRWPSK